ncbi:MAG TPA: hypothetical protein VJ714_11565, partial [Anaerolineae bacterium]|nr:hypothetical protein [Anaerolineae bacterium]
MAGSLAPSGLEQAFADVPRLFFTLPLSGEIMARSIIRAHRELWAVLIAFLLLGGVYSTVTPLFEAPDEIQHYFHIKHIADGKGLPVLRPEEEVLYGQEGGQPSLYYALGALTTFWIDTDDAEGLLDY